MHVKSDKPPSPQMKRNAERRKRQLHDPDIRPQARTSGCWRRPLQQQPPSHQVLQAPDIRRQPRTSSASPSPGHPPRRRKSGTLQIESNKVSSSSPDIRPVSPDIRLSVKPQTSGPSPGRLTSPAYVQCIRSKAHVPLHPLDYIYSPSTYVLGLALI